MCFQLKSIYYLVAEPPECCNRQPQAPSKGQAALVGDQVDKSQVKVGVVKLLKKLFILQQHLKNLDVFRLARICYIPYLTMYVSNTINVERYAVGSLGIVPQNLGLKHCILKSYIKVTQTVTVDQH